MHDPILKAVFPVAGLGTRFLPATKVTPKEMLPVVNKPLIQYALEEAYAAGIRQMIFVTNHNKSSIEDHFDMSWELEAELIAHNKMELLSLIKAVKPDDMECFYLRQPRALGLGHAVLCAETLIGKEAFAVILPDDLIVGETSTLKQMVELYEERLTSIVAVEEINKEDTLRYGLISGEFLKNDLIDVNYIVEKPKPEVAPSNIAVVGRYILTSGIFTQLRQLKPGVNEEMQLTDAIKNLLQTEQVLGYCYKGTRYDCGSILGFLKANVALGRIDPTLGKPFSEWLQETLGFSSMR